MKSTLSLLLFALFISAQAQTQSIQFEYDAAGNCVVKYKTVTLPSKASRHINDENQDENQPDNNLILTDDVFGEIITVISPNPTKGILNIEFKNKAAELPVSYTLTQMNGKRITSGKTTDNPLDLDLSKFSTGIYLLRLTIEDKTETYKIIKQ